MNLNIYKRGAQALASLSLLVSCSSVPEKPANMQTLTECGSWPNCVNTQSGKGVHASEPLLANTRQWKNLKSWIAQQKDWEITSDEEFFMQAIAKTPVMRFRDDVQLLFLPDVSLIHVRSSSRLGYGDLGANARRVETLRGLLE